ncbi:MAG: cell envelope integrity EipB family protein [Bosea sp. (in: a-proteobacteria)]
MTIRIHSLALVLPLAASAPGLSQAQERVVLVPHRAVYELMLDPAKPAKAIENAKGRIAFDFTGDACEGYALSFRQVTELAGSETGARVIDARTNSFEGGAGESFRFKTETQVSGVPSEIVDGIATQGASDGMDVALKLPKQDTHRFEGKAVFPSGQLKLAIQAARAGERTMSVRMFDGSDDGRQMFETLTVIGRKIEAGEALDKVEEPLKTPDFAKLPRWPVKMSYFKESTGEQTPSYTISFDLYENGVTGAVKMDYGEFALKATLTRLDLLPVSACAK